MNLLIYQSKLAETAEEEEGILPRNLGRNLVSGKEHVYAGSCFY